MCFAVLVFLLLFFAVTDRWGPVVVERSQPTRDAREVPLCVNPEERCVKEIFIVLTGLLLCAFSL